MDWSDAARWITAAVVILGVAWAPVACTMNNNEKINAAIERGVDPIKARCAYASDPGAVTCAVVAAKGASHE